MPCKKSKQEQMKIAVRNLSFAVNKGEVFGLLGPNGAGKTTVLNMMIAEIHPDKGKVSLFIHIMCKRWLVLKIQVYPSLSSPPQDDSFVFVVIFQVVVAGHDVHSNLSEAFQALGYCPQHDAQWDTIRLEEHLECYAAIKGIAKKDIPLVVDQYISLFLYHSKTVSIGIYITCSHETRFYWINVTTQTKRLNLLNCLFSLYSVHSSITYSMKLCKFLHVFILFAVLLKT